MMWGSFIGGALGAIIAFTWGVFVGRQHGYVAGYHAARLELLIERIEEGEGNE